MIVIAGCAIFSFITAALIVTDMCSRRCRAVRAPCCGAYGVAEFSEEKAAMAASFLSTPRSVKKLVSCGMRLARPPVLFTWCFAGLVATIPLLLIEFFDWTSRALEVTRFSGVTSKFSAFISIEVLFWFEFACIMLWTALTVVEICFSCSLLVHHFRVLSLFRSAYVADLHPIDDEAGDVVISVDEQQETRESRFYTAAISRSYGFAIAIVWILRTAATFAAFLFSGLQLFTDALLIHTVMAAAGGIGIVQIWGSAFIIIRHARRADKKRRASIKRLPPMGRDPLLQRRLPHDASAALANTNRVVHGGGEQDLGRAQQNLQTNSDTRVIDFESASGIAFDSSLVAVEERLREQPRAGFTAASHNRRRSSNDARQITVLPFSAISAANTPHDPDLSAEGYSHEPTSPVAQRFSISGVAVPMLELRNPEGSKPRRASVGSPAARPLESSRQRCASVGSPASHLRESSRRSRKAFVGALGTSHTVAPTTELVSPSDVFLIAPATAGSSTDATNLRPGTISVHSTAIRDRLAAFLARHDPARLAQTAQLAQSVAGDTDAEAGLLDRFRREYGKAVPASVKVLRAAACTTPAESPALPPGACTVQEEEASTHRSAFASSTVAAVISSAVASKAPRVGKGAASTFTNAPSNTLASSPRGDVRTMASHRHAPVSSTYLQSVSASPAHITPPSSAKVPSPIAAAAPVRPPPVSPTASHSQASGAANSSLVLAQQLQQVAQVHIEQAVQLQQAAQLFAASVAAPVHSTLPALRTRPIVGAIAGARSSEHKSPLPLYSSVRKREAAFPSDALASPASRSSPLSKEHSAAPASGEPHLDMPGQARVPPVALGSVRDDAAPAPSARSTHRSADTARTAANGFGISSGRLMSPRGPSLLPGGSARSTGSARSVSETLESLAASSRVLRRSPRVPTATALAAAPMQGARGQTQAVMGVVESARSAASEAAQQDPTNA